MLNGGRSERGTNSAKRLNALSAISQANQTVDRVSLKLLHEAKPAKAYFYTGILLEVKRLGY